MKKYWQEIIAWGIIAAGVALAAGIGFLFAARVYEHKLNKLENEIQDHYYYIGELENELAWFDDYIDLIEEIYEGKITEAVLEERIKQLENAKNGNLSSDIYDDYVYQLLEDFDDAIEIIIHYYENTDQAVDLVTYIATNYPALYARLLTYA